MSEDRINMKTADIVPVASFDQEFTQWLEGVGSGSARAQHPIDELLAEHHLMDAALAAMERETRRLSVHHDLRPDAWEEIVDFMGNFVYQVHRRKEEQGLFPVWRELVGEGQALPEVDKIAGEHEQAAQLTVDLVNGVNSGDWEKVLRAAHVYLRVARDHLIREEQDVFEPMRAALDPESIARLRTKFAELEKFGLGDRDRAYYLELAKRMCERAGLGAILGE